MNENKKYSIENLYTARITEKYRPLYAKHSEFIKSSRYYLYFERFEDKYREVITNRVIDNEVQDLSEAKVGTISIINPKPVNKKKFTKIQLENGYVTLYDVVNLYKNQKAMNRDKERQKTKLKVKVLEPKYGRVNRKVA